MLYRKPALIMFVLMMLFPLLLTAESNFLSAGPYYLTWAESIYGEEADREIRTSRNTKDETVVSADKVSSYSSPSTFEVARLSFLFMDMNIYYTGKTYQTMCNKTKAFFCAIEAGNALNLSKLEILEWDRAAEAFLNDQVFGYIREVKEAIYADGYHPFYTTQKGTYYFRYEYNSRIMIYFVPKDQAPLSAETVKPAAGLTDILQAQGDWELKFASEAKNCVKEYYDATLDNLTLTLSAETGHAQAVNIRCTWKAKNSPDMSKKMLELFSDDLATNLHQKYPELVIDQMTVFWSVPYIAKTGYAAKYQYASDGAEITRQNEFGLLYGKD